MNFRSLTLFIVLVCFVIPFSSIAIAQERNEESTKRSIDSLLTQWHLAATNADFDIYFGSMTNDAIFIGTDASEVWNQEQFKSYSKPHFDKKNTWDFKTLTRNIYLNDSQDLGWFDELLNTWMGICRGSGVVKNTSEGWRIQQYVLSITVPNDTIKEVVRVKEAWDHEFITNLKER